MQRKPTARQDWCGYQRKWYEANKEKILAKKRHRYRVERARGTERYMQILQYGRDYYWSDPEKFAEYQRQRKVLNSRE